MQPGHKIAIKGMVCDRCIHTVSRAMKAQGIPVAGISLGEVTTVFALSASDVRTLAAHLEPLGFSLLEDKKEKLVRDVKALVEEVYSGTYDFPHGFRFSDLVAKRFHKDYKSISAVFIEQERAALEQYIITYRTAKVKELLVYTNNTLADIAFRLGFSSAAHLSRQFKSQTGLNTSHFRDIQKEKTCRQTQRNG